MADQLEADAKKLNATKDTLKTRKINRKRVLRLSRN